jgi:hypothetical protein
MNAFGRLFSADFCIDLPARGRDLLPLAALLSVVNRLARHGPGENPGNYTDVRT